MGFNNCSTTLFQTLSFMVLLPSNCIRLTIQSKTSEWKPYGLTLTWCSASCWAERHRHCPQPGKGIWKLSWLSDHLCNCNISSFLQHAQRYFLQPCYTAVWKTSYSVPENGFFSRTMDHFIKQKTCVTLLTYHAAKSECLNFLIATHLLWSTMQSLVGGL